MRDEVGQCMAEPANGGHEAADRTADPGRAAPGERTVVGQRLRKAMEMPAPTEAAMPTRNVCQVLCVANAAAKSGASVDTEPSISPASPGCTYCSMNARLEVASSLSRAPFGENLFAQLVSKAFVAGFGLGELNQSLTHGNSRAPSAPCGSKRCGLVLHLFSELADFTEDERPRQPQGVLWVEEIPLRPGDG